MWIFLDKQHKILCDAYLPKNPYLKLISNQCTARKYKYEIQILNFMKIRQVGAELFHADWRTDGQTDLKRLISRFSQIYESAKK
jgi:hypothetical protein